MYQFFHEEKDWMVLQVKPENWIYQPGLPDTAIMVKSSRLMRVEEAVQQWLATPDTLQNNTTSWTTHEWLYFFKLIKAHVNAPTMQDLDDTFHFTESTNAEIVATWFEIGLQVNYLPIAAALEKFLVKVGRRKFVLPLYRVLMQTEQNKEKARQIFEKARGNYHAVTRQSIEKLLAL